MEPLNEENELTVEDRLLLIEDKLAFVMHSMRMARKEGKIQPKMVSYSLMDLYLEAKARQMQALLGKDLAAEAKTGEDAPAPMPTIVLGE